MNKGHYQDAAEFIRNDLRLKTFPLAVKFLTKQAGFPEKTRRPSAALGKRITICQGVAMARLYGWTVGLTKDDLICVPAMLIFGFSDTEEPQGHLAGLFCEVGFKETPEAARRETETISAFANHEYEGIVLAPLAKGLFEPDTTVMCGNPAQVTRLIQAWLYTEGERIPGSFGGKVECAEYLISPYATRSPRVVIPGMGDRIFSMTQDEEMVFALPGSSLPQLVRGLKEAGRKIGSRYPITFYQNFQPEFPEDYVKLGKKLALL
jgi:uncharacterized protein (DUF169 family)